MAKVNEIMAKFKQQNCEIESFLSRKIWIPIISIIVLIFLFWFFPYYLGFFGEDSTKESRSIITQHQVFYYYLSLVFTLLLISIAYFQLRGVKGNIRAKFLLEIDWRWGNRENLEARKIIHKMVKDAERRHGKLCEDTREKITGDIGDQILAMRDSHKESDCEQFVYLLNFIDFMETIGYLHKCGYVELKDLQELCGHSLKFNYEIFQKYIHDRDQRQSDSNVPNKGHIDFYKYFSELYEEILNQK